MIDTKYEFENSSLGHGFYGISSNGGVWSNIAADKNNCIKTFKFDKGDKINV